MAKQKAKKPGQAGKSKTRKRSATAKGVRRAALKAEARRPKVRKRQTVRQDSSVRPGKPTLEELLVAAESAELARAIDSRSSGWTVL